jgi:hypothetical protein
MQFLRRLFGGGGSAQQHLKVYVKPKMCKTILQLDVDLINQLSMNDDGEGYWVRKIANSPRCPFEAEVTLYFDKNRKLINREISNGEFVTEAVYQEYLSSGQA